MFHICFKPDEQVIWKTIANVNFLIRL